MCNKIHAFEKAGLGLAPFRCVGVERRVGPIKIGEQGGCEMWSGSPGQPMGVCGFCGTGIADCYVIVSSDKKRFIVGCECVKKTDDRGLIDTVKREANRIQRERKALSDNARIDVMGLLLDRPEVWAKLHSLPHPMGFAGKSAADWVSWMIRNSGTTGKVRVAKWLENQSF